MATESLNLDETLKVAVVENWDGDPPETKNSIVSYGALLSGESVWTCIGPSMIAHATINQLLKDNTKRVVVIIGVNSFNGIEEQLSAVEGVLSTIVVANTEAKNFANFSTVCAKHSAALAFFPKEASFAQAEVERTVDSLRRFIKSHIDNIEHFSDDEFPQDSNIRTPYFLPAPKSFPNVQLSQVTNKVQPVDKNSTNLDNDDLWLLDLKTRSEELASQKSIPRAKQARSPDPSSMQTPPRPPSSSTQEQGNGGADSGQVRSFFEGLLSGSPITLTPPHPPSSVSGTPGAAVVPPPSQSSK